MKPKKPSEREQTVVLTIEATYILKGKDMLKPSDVARGNEMFPLEKIDLDVCPNADHVDIKKIKVFERG